MTTSSFNLLFYKDKGFIWWPCGENSGDNQALFVDHGRIKVRLEIMLIQKMAIHSIGKYRLKDIPFKEFMKEKTQSLIVTSGDRTTAQPMIDSTILCSRFLGMRFHGKLWGKAKAPGEVLRDQEA